MKMLMISAMMIFTLCSIMMMISMNISKKMFINREKNSAFECGFDPHSKSRMPFSIHFFIITILFLIFDIEISILLPFFITMNNSNMNNYLIMFYMFLMILILGIFHEWNNNILNWKI
uniref:NADH-ubiquinone oxidoreductase chain 3 n=1 Tax=Psychomyia kalais TaxID=2904897 RepID=A0A9E8LPB4_9NEOP|nr:NADH dehydrogenase subunit 3 [Psychomyia kalais]UZZ44344.1 NADH dehydrogenase subunit 3 [Psychomyia kalais]